MYLETWNCTVECRTKDLFPHTLSYLSLITWNRFFRSHNYSVTLLHSSR